MIDPQHGVVPYVWTGRETARASAARRCAPVGPSPETPQDRAGKGEPLRFAFYGRSGQRGLSGESSYDRQLRLARQLIEPHGGQIVAEYFDKEMPRATPWHHRPQVRALLADAHTTPGHFEAVAIGHTSHVFNGEPHMPYWLFPALLDLCRVSMWIPEIGGPVDPFNEQHDLIMRIHTDPIRTPGRHSPYRSFGAAHDGGVW
jgi:hypothetical protein